MPNHQAEIAILVISRDGNNVCFFINKETPLIKLIRAYCHRCTISMESVNFKFRGVLIREVDTAKSMGIKDKNIINVVHLYPGNPIITPPNVIDTDGIIVKILSWDDQTVSNYYTWRSTPIITILEQQCRKSGITSQAHIFRYNGIDILESDSADSLGMEDGDTLDILCAQEGG